MNKLMNKTFFAQLLVGKLIFWHMTTAGKGSEVHTYISLKSKPRALTKSMPSFVATASIKSRVKFRPTL